MKKTLSALLSLSTLLCCQAKENRIAVSNIADLAHATLVRGKPGISFSFVGRITSAPSQNNPHFAIENETGRIALRGRPFWTNGTIRAGDLVRATGVTVTIEPNGPKREVSPNCYEIEVLSHRTPPTPPLAALPDIRAGRHDYSPVRVHGTIRDCFRDEIDPGWIFLVLTDNHESVYCSFVWKPGDSSGYGELIGAEVEVSALVLPKTTGRRRFLGRHLSLHGIPDIHVLKATQGDPFDTPDISVLQTKRASEISVLGRHKAIGRVIATWDENCFLIRTSDGDTVRVCLADKCAPPRIDSIVEVSGLPETELFNINLSRAIWRTAKAVIPPEPPPKPVCAEDIIANLDGTTRINTKLHGLPIRLIGIVRNVSSPHHFEKRLYLSGGPILVQVDASATPGILDTLELDSKVEITGICRIETDSIYPDSAFPHVKGLTVMLRTDADLHVLARPPWWTPRKFTIVLGMLLLLLIGFLAWIIMLRRVSERKGRALARASIAKAASELKVHERTRLATELHDSIVQSLTGASMELRAVLRLNDSNRDEADRQFNLALKTLDACRGELRNCIWDLRNRALDEPTVDQALRRTLAPHAEGIRLSIRFAVARRRLTDNTTHALISIVREFVVNAVRHGHAQTIMVAGCVDNGRLCFSIRDTGIGFDLAQAPGPDAGHFGIQGIRERVEALHGSMTIQSQMGKGTKATVSFPLAPESKT